MLLYEVENLYENDLFFCFNEKKKIAYGWAKMTEYKFLGILLTLLCIQEQQ